MNLTIIWLSRYAVSLNSSYMSKTYINAEKHIQIKKRNRTVTNNIVQVITMSWKNIDIQQQISFVAQIFLDSNLVTMYVHNLCPIHFLLNCFYSMASKCVFLIMRKLYVNEPAFISCGVVYKNN